MLAKMFVAAAALAFALPLNAARYFGHLDGTFVNGQQTYWVVGGATPTDYASAPMSGYGISIDFDITERKDYWYPGCPEIYCHFSGYYDVSLYFRAKGPMNDIPNIWTVEIDTPSKWSSIYMNSTTPIFGPSGGWIDMDWPYSGQNIQELLYTLNISKGHGGKVSGIGSIIGRQIPEYEMSISGDFVITSGTFSVRGSVPEPASWATLVLGLGLVGSSLRRGVARQAKDFAIPQRS